MKFHPASIMSSPRRAMTLERCLTHYMAGPENTDMMNNQRIDPGSESYGKATNLEGMVLVTNLVSSESLTDSLTLYVGDRLARYSLEDTAITARRASKRSTNKANLKVLA